MNVNRKTDALIIIDIQNDFCPNGALAVVEGDTIIPGVVYLAKEFDTIILSQDLHPKDHAFFASQHQTTPFSEIEMPYGSQTLWPDHCVQGSQGAQFHPELVKSGLVDKACAIIRKGMHPEVDSYSVFFENDKLTSTGLSGFLKEKDIKRLFFVGLAYDFCVGYSALDAKSEGFDSFVVKDLTRAIGMPLGSKTTLKAGLKEAAAKSRENITTIDSIEKKFKEKGGEILDENDLIYSNSPKPRI